MLDKELEQTLNSLFAEAREQRYEFMTIEHLLFELITLSLPNKRQHPENKDGTTNCNTEMINLIDKYNHIEEKSSDPRWDALKDLKIK